LNKGKFLVTFSYFQNLILVAPDKFIVPPLNDKKL
jgi:hypothetical protein